MGQALDWRRALVMQVHAIMGKNGSGKSTLSKATVLNLNFPWFGVP